MKQVKDNKCELHNLIFTKIQKNSKRLLCDKCTSQGEDQRRQRLEAQRIKLTKAYQIQLNELRQAKKQTDKVMELFQARNMSEAKKIINKSSPDIQKIVETTIEKEVKQANKVLKQKSEELLQPWKAIDGRTFSPAYLEFEAQIQAIEAKLNELRATLKQQIADKLKQEVRAFYINLFEL